MSSYDMQLLDIRDEAICTQLRQLPHRELLLEASDQDHLHPVVAINGDQVIGAAGLYRLKIHPTRLQLEIFVDPMFRRQGIGTSLFSACIHNNHLESDDEIQTSVSSSEDGEVAFLLSVDFLTLMTTHLGQLLWHNIPDVTVNLQPAEITTLAANPDSAREVADVHEQIYRSQHSWSPVGELTERFRTSVFLDPDELVPEAQFIALLDETVVGVASLPAPFSIQSPDLGWIGVLDTLPDSIANTIHAQLLNACLEFTRNQKANVFVEIDESDTRTLEAFRTLNVNWESQWPNLVKRV